jgi:hypothetical protein
VIYRRGLDVKKISIFFDGTGNIGKDGAANNTNVFKLWQKVDQEKQLALYIEGIGTDPRPVATSIIGWIQICAQRNYDQLLGVGASERVRRAYFFLAKNYQKNDQVFLFGFSRGAFIARMLAGFIHRVGLLFADKTTESMVDHAFALYCADEGGIDFENYVRPLEATVGRREGIVTHFLGQWDAVEALDVFGMSDKEEALLRQAAAREHRDPLPTWIRNACHALALHEARQKFEPLLWSGVRNDKQTLKQVWFAGAHADVGGGYASDDGAGTRYSDIALQWMWCESKLAGLAVPEPAAWKAAQNDDIPHIPSWRTFGGMAPRVRSALASMAERDNNFEYLHESALDRLHTPIESAYNQVVDRVTAIWRRSDSISMHAHFAQYFGVTRLPTLSPKTVASAEDLFFKFLVKQKYLTQGKLELALKLMLAFDRQPHMSNEKDEVSDYDADVMHLLMSGLLGLEGAVRSPCEPWTVISERRKRLQVWLSHFVIEVLCLTSRQNKYAVERKKSKV